MKKLLISAFVVSIFAGSYAIADETIQLAAAIGATKEEHLKKKIKSKEKHIERRVENRDKHLDRDAARARGEKHLERKEAKFNKHILADKAYLASLVASAIAVAAEAGGTSTATHH